MSVTRSEMFGECCPHEVQLDESPATSAYRHSGADANPMRGSTRFIRRGTSGISRSCGKPVHTTLCRSARNCSPRFGKDRLTRCRPSRTAPRWQARLRSTFAFWGIQIVARRRPLPSRNLADRYRLLAMAVRARPSRQLLSGARHRTSPSRRRRASVAARDGVFKPVNSKPLVTTKIEQSYRPRYNLWL